MNEYYSCTFFIYQKAYDILQKKREGKFCMEKKKIQYSIWSNWKFIYGNLFRYDKKVVFFQAAEVILQVLNRLALVLLPAAIIQMLDMHVDINVLARNLLIIFLIVGVLNGGTSYLMGRNRYQYIQFRAGYMIRRVVYKVLSIDYVQYEDTKIQKLMNNALNAVGSNGAGLEGIIHKTANLLVAVFSLGIFSLMVAKVNILLVVLLVVVSLIQIGVYRLASNYELQHSEEKAGYRVNKEYFNHVAYQVNTGKDIRLYRMKNWLTNEYQKANSKYQKIVAKEKLGYFANDLGCLFLQILRDGCCYYFFIQQLQAGMQVAEFVLYLGIIAGFSTYFNQITMHLMGFQRDQISMQYLREFWNMQTLFNHGSGKKMDPKSQGFTVEFDQVSFSYPKEEGEKRIQILDQISFKIEAGKKLALVGINGAGKSTIVKLMCGFYQPDCGCVRINGVDLKEMNLDDYYSYLAVVFQEAFSYSFSILENISCDLLENSNQEKGIQALKKAGLWEKIQDLSLQEKTFLNKDIEEEGIQLSGGEMQKLMLARALYKDCKLVLLDEPTAALDAIAEHEMYQKYATVLEGKSALFISHRLASTRFCDDILFLENGKIIECGTHEELMEQNGQYANMFQVQSKYYKEGKDGEAVNVETSEELFSCH